MKSPTPGRFPIGIERVGRYWTVAFRENAVRTESRRHPRREVNATILILWWNPSGQERVATARIVNVSPAGVRLQVDEPMPLRTYVYCNDERLSIAGCGSVRYCNYARGKYNIGLEFGSGTGWQEPVEASLSHAGA